MSQPVAGPSGLCNSRNSSTRTNLFELFSGDQSDEDDDFEGIPHQSDDSGSSSEEEDDVSVRSSVDENGWHRVDEHGEQNRPRLDPNFTARNPKSPHNIDYDTCKEPIDFFSLFMDDEIWVILHRETNRYARQFLEQDEIIMWMETHKYSRYHRWPEEGVTVEQLKKYIGLILNMGLIPKKKLCDFWSTCEEIETRFFGKVMSFNEFSLIRRMIHMNDVTKEKKRGEEGFDPWCKVRPMLDKVNESSKRFYVPSQNVSIDESMIGMKNRVIYIQYMPNKRHARFGIKKFQICDSNGYVIHLTLYAGKDFDVHDDQGQAYAVVKNLMEEAGLLNKGYHLVTDNFYTKPAITEFLLSKKTLLTGTVRANSRGLPEGRSEKLAVGEARFWHKGEMLFVSFREKKSQTKPVHLLSTGYNAKVEEITIRGNQKVKPSAIFHYNKYMGGVDISDKQICHLASERSTRRYWVKIFQNLVDICVLNSWILFNLHMKDINKPEMPRDKFVILIVRALCGRSREPQPANPAAAADQRTGHVVEVIPHKIVLLQPKKEKDCFVCSNRVADKKSSRGRKRTRYWCPDCKVGCHPHCEPKLEHITDQGLTPKRRRI